MFNPPPAHEIPDSPRPNPASKNHLPASASCSSDRRTSTPHRAPSSFKLPASTGLVLLRRSGLELVRPLHTDADPYELCLNGYVKCRENDRKPATQTRQERPSEIQKVGTLNAARWSRRGAVRVSASMECLTDAAIRSGMIGTWHS